MKSYRLKNFRGKSCHKYGNKQLNEKIWNSPAKNKRVAVIQPETMISQLRTLNKLKTFSVILVFIYKPLKEVFEANPFRQKAEKNYSIRIFSFPFHNSNWKMMAPIRKSTKSWKNPKIRSFLSEYSLLLNVWRKILFYLFFLVNTPYFVYKQYNLIVSNRYQKKF